jgi:hypothetical protein
MSAIQPVEPVSHTGSHVGGTGSPVLEEALGRISWRDTQQNSKNPCRQAWLGTKVLVSMVAFASQKPCVNSKDAWPLAGNVTILNFWAAGIEKASESVHPLRDGLCDARGSDSLAP